MHWINAPDVSPGFFTLMKILFAVNMPFPEGRASTRRIRTIAREMVRQGHKVSILLPFSREPKAKNKIIDGIYVRWCLTPSKKAEFQTINKRVKLSIQFLSRFRWMMELWLKSKRKEYDWLYLYQPGIDGLIAARIARYFGRRILSEYVDLFSSDEYDTPIWRIFYKLQVFADRKVPFYSNIILTISSVLKNIYQYRNPDVPILIFPTLVDTSKFGKGDPYRYRQELSLGNRTVISFTGSFVRTEGLHVLIEAIANVLKRNHDLILLIAGGSLVPKSDDAGQLIKQYRLQTNALYLGALSEEDVIDLQAASDILVMPKLDAPVNHAGLSTKLAEYLASEKPVIASNVGDVGKYLIDGQDALLIPPGNRNALEIALLRLLKDRELCNVLGANGRKKAIQHFGIEANVMRLMNILLSYN